MAHSFDPSLLRDYDMRGIVGETLGVADGYAVGRSFGTLIVRAGGRRAVVGYDGRLSSAMLEEAVVRGLIDSGVDVDRIGLGPTPMLYHAQAVLDVDGGIQVTGSHNPADHNGFKLMFQGEAFFGEAIQRLGAMAAAGDWVSGRGSAAPVAMLDRYVARLVEGFDGAPHRIGWDAGNGAAGPAVEKLVKLLPGEHHLLFTDIDGNFPNHHPDPTIEANLADLKALVMDKKLDFGVAFDGDGDRIGVVDALGRSIGGDQLLALLAEPLLRDRPGATIIADVKASQALFDRVSELGGTPLMWKSGHSHIKSKMKETGCLLAGETSGHLFFGAPYHGVDDGLYAAVQLIRAATALGRSVTALHDSLPVMANTPELRFPIAGACKFAVVDAVRARLEAAGADVDVTDGVRVRTAEGWWLLRASHTQDMLTARVEGRDQETLNRLIRTLDSHLIACGVSRAA